MDFYSENTLTEDGKRLYRLGEVHMNKVCVVFLCGGQGTRLGSDQPKGCFVLPRLNKCLFEVHFQKIRDLEKRHGVRIKVFLMTSTFTHDDTENFLRKNRNFGLDVTLFDQDNTVCLDFEMKALRFDEKSFCESPNGNGGLINALFKHRVIWEMRKAGIRWINVLSIDNILANICDPLAIGLLYSRNLDILSKAVAKQEGESVGLFVRENDNYVVKEYTEGRAESRLANICHHYFRLDFFLKIREKRIEYHLARKKIPYVSNGALVKPEAPNGYKRELFIFDVFCYAEGNEVILAPRALEFSPLKNSDKEVSNNPTTCVNDYLKLKSRIALLSTQRLSSEDQLI